MLGWAVNHVTKLVILKLNCIAQQSYIETKTQLDRCCIVTQSTFIGVKAKFESILLAFIFCFLFVYFLRNGHQFGCVQKEFET